MFRVADRSLLISVFALIIVGLIMIASSSYFAELKAGRDAIFYIKRQFNAALLGFILMGLAAYTDYRRLKSFAPLLYFLMLILLTAGHFFGVAAQGAQRWLILGPFSFQPSEVAKLIMIICLASYFDLKKERSNIILPLLLTAIPFFLVFKQPDLGTALVIAALAFGMLAWNKHSPVILTMIATPIFSILLRPNIYLWIIYIILLWLALYLSREDLGYDHNHVA
jgi:rod shape determining protein RodA